LTADHDLLTGIHLPAALEPVYLPQCDSAMEECARRARAGAPEGTLVWAGHQSAAQGRLGSQWLSPAGALHCAVVLRPELAAARLGEFVPLSVVALGMALAGLVVPMTELRYRWPNAVLLSDGRVAGAWLSVGSDWLVLAASVNVTETANAENFRHACVHFDGGNPEATVTALLEAYAHQLVTGLARWDDEGFAPVLRHFRSRVEQMHADVALCLPDGTRATGRAEAIDHNGSLLLDTANGKRVVTINEYMGLPQA
jgi:BirA family biotin operon repressor/biotin-[acetyl-CoA-carboxylase] ligase